MKTVKALMNRSQSQLEDEQKRYLLEDIGDFTKDSLKLNKRKLKNLERDREESQLKCNTQAGLQAYLDISVEIDQLEDYISKIEEIVIK